MEENFDILNILREQKEIKLKGNLYHYVQVIFAYNTNHIEGSTLTEEETRYIFNEKSIPPKNTATKLNDILETINHFKLVDYMLDVADKNLDENMIKEFHKILKQNTNDSEKSWFAVGDYKKLTNEIGISGTKTTSPENVGKEIKNLLLNYNKIEQKTIEDIIDFHVKFEKIHPFQDGNGRVGRIIMFKECLKENIVPFIILDKNKDFYYRGLKEYETEKGYLIDTCLDSQDYFAEMVKYYLAGASIDTFLEKNKIILSYLYDEVKGKGYFEKCYNREDGFSLDLIEDDIKNGLITEFKRKGNTYLLYKDENKKIAINIKTNSIIKENKLKDLVQDDLVE